MKTFEKWKIDELHQQFAVKRILQGFLLLDDWLNIDTNTISKADRDDLEKLRLNLFENADFWNEDELNRPAYKHRKFENRQTEDFYTTAY